MNTDGLNVEQKVLVYAYAIAHWIGHMVEELAPHFGIDLDQLHAPSQGDQGATPISPAPVTIPSQGDQGATPISPFTNG